MIYMFLYQNTYFCRKKCVCCKLWFFWWFKLMIKILSWWFKLVIYTHTPTQNQQICFSDGLVCLWWTSILRVLTYDLHPFVWQFSVFWAFFFYHSYYFSSSSCFLRCLFLYFSSFFCFFISAVDAQVEAEVVVLLLTFVHSHEGATEVSIVNLTFVGKRPELDLSMVRP